MFNDVPFFPAGNNYGKDGKDGVSPTIAVTNISGGHKLTIVDVTGTKTVDVLNGTEGPVGPQGVQGIPGAQGPKGDQGERGEQGPQGLPGDQGVQGETGPRGADGPKGETGKSAYECAKESGYTGSETEFANALANLVNKQNITLGIHTDGLIYLFINGEPVGTGIEKSSNTEAPIIGFVDTDNNIVLTGMLEAGVYSCKYENEDGSFTEIGSIEIKENDELINLITTAVGLDGTGLYNGVGYKDGTYISMDSIDNPPSKDGSDTTTVATGLIPYDWKALYIKGVSIDPSVSHCRAQYITADYLVKYQLASGSWAWTNFIKIEELGTNYYKLTPLYTSQNPGALEDLDNIAYIRFSFIGTGTNLIISPNEIT